MHNVSFFFTIFSCHCSTQVAISILGDFGDLSVLSRDIDRNVCFSVALRWLLGGLEALFVEEER